MGVQVKAWKGAGWIFVNHKGHRKAKRVGTGKEGHRVAIAAAEKIQARLVLGGLSLLEAAKPQEITLRECAEQWLATDAPYVGSLGRLRRTEACSATTGCLSWAR
jgi:hypothetical protein